MKSPWFSLNHISHLATVEIRVVRLGSFQNLYLSFAIVEITHGVTANRDDTLSSCREMRNFIVKISFRHNKCRSTKRVFQEFLPTVVNHVCCLNKHAHDSGGTVAQWLALLPHSKKVLGSFPAQPGPFCVEFACSPRVCVGFLRVLRFPPTSKDMHRQC